MGFTKNMKHDDSRCVGGDTPDYEFGHCGECSRTRNCNICGAPEKKTGNAFRCPNGHGELMRRRVGGGIEYVPLAWTRGAVEIKV